MCKWLFLLVEFGLAASHVLNVICVTFSVKGHRVFYESVHSKPAVILVSRTLVFLHRMRFGPEMLFGLGVRGFLGKLEELHRHLRNLGND